MGFIAVERSEYYCSMGDDTGYMGYRSAAVIMRLSYSGAVWQYMCVASTGTISGQTTTVQYQWWTQLFMREQWLSLFLACRYTSVIWMTGWVQTVRLSSSEHAPWQRVWRVIVVGWIWSTLIIGAAAFPAQLPASIILVICQIAWHMLLGMRWVTAVI